MAPANQCISMFVEALLFRPGWRLLTSFLPYLSDQVIRENPASRGTEVSYLLLPRLRRSYMAYRVTDRVRTARGTSVPHTDL